MQRSTPPRLSHLLLPDTQPAICWSDTGFGVAYRSDVDGNLEIYQTEVLYCE